MRLRIMGRGGMQSSSLKPSIICPVCHKPAFRKDVAGRMAFYKHFTKNGSKTCQHIEEEQP